MNLKSTCLYIENWLFWIEVLHKLLVHFLLEEINWGIIRIKHFQAWKTMFFHNWKNNFGFQGTVVYSLQACPCSKGGLPKIITIVLFNVFLSFKIFYISFCFGLWIGKPQFFGWEKKHLSLFFKIHTKTVAIG